MENRSGEYGKRVYKYSGNFSIFEPEKYFKDYDFYEVYDSSKNYTSDRFFADYGHGKRIYEYYKWVIENNNGFSKKKKFIVAFEILSRDDRNELVKYCNCRYHKSNKFWQAMAGQARDDCVAEYGHYNPEMIKLARERMAEKASDDQSLLVNDKYSSV